MAFVNLYHESTKEKMLTLHYEQDFNITDFTNLELFVIKQELDRIMGNVTVTICLVNKATGLSIGVAT